MVNGSYAPVSFLAALLTLGALSLPFVASPIIGGLVGCGAALTVGVLMAMVRPLRPAGLGVLAASLAWPLSVFGSLALLLLVAGLG